MSSKDDTAAACPVDHHTREAWLTQAKMQNVQAGSPAPPYPLPSEGCGSSQMDQANTRSSILPHLKLGSQREVSTIPRAADAPGQPAPSRPANSEKDTGADKETGNWIYPSEEMFFNAMKRKGYGAEANDMKTIVPIHNAVNERAWQEIKQWERGRGADACGGPRLASFSGLSSSLTPRARWNTLLGYSAPFDRHDWVVDRCGTKVEYVIDFYAGKNEKQSGKALNFYLDVRPKLNSWEGVRTRILHFWGL